MNTVREIKQESFGNGLEIRAIDSSEELLKKKIKYRARASQIELEGFLKAIQSILGLQAKVICHSYSKKKVDIVVYIELL